MKPHQQPGIARSRAVRRDEATRRTASSRSITEYDKWIEGIRLSEGQFGKPGYRSPGAWSSRIMSNSKSMPCNRDDERFHWHENESEESDHVDRDGSPVVPWRKSPTDESSLMLHDHEKVYSAVRTQEIADYRKEMMDMVRGLPESDFELTLQDIVEKRKDFNKEVEVPVTTPVMPVTAPDKELARNKETKRKKNQRSYVIVERSKSIDTGLLARMFSPLSVVTRRKSLNLRDRSGEKEVKEKNKAIERKKNSKDEEWWKKNEFSEKGSNSSSVGSSTSNDSGSGGSSSNDDRFSRNMSMKQTRCSCFRPGKIKIRPGKMKPKSS